MNALRNAAKFTPATRRDGVSLVARMDRPHLLLIEVADRGPGLRGKSLAQLVSGNSGFGSPSGLGLSISVRLAELMSGTVRLEDRFDGPGAVFMLSLPLADGRSPRGGGGGGGGGGSARAVSLRGSARVAPSGPGAASIFSPRHADVADAADAVDTAPEVEVRATAAVGPRSAAAGPPSDAAAVGVKKGAAASASGSVTVTVPSAPPAHDSETRRYTSMQHLLAALPVAHLVTRTLGGTASGRAARAPRDATSSEGGPGAGVQRSRDDAGIVVRMRSSAVVTSPGAADAPHAPLRDLRGTRVLLADHSPANLQFAVFVLKRLGCVVGTCTDGDEVVAAADAAAASGTPFDVCVSELYMDRMNGDAALAALRAAGHTMPVLLCTANATNADAMWFRSLGFAGQLGKPYWSDQMHAALVAAMAPAGRELAEL